MPHTISLSVPESLALCENAFKNVIGQSVAKSALTASIVSASQDGFLPSTLLYGPAGTGKSFIIAAWKDAVRAVLGRKRIYFETGKAVGSKVSFTEEYLIPHFHDQSAVLIVDECHEMGNDAKGIFRTMIQPDADRSTVTFRPYKDYEITFDPTRNSVLLATNKIDKIDPALMSRLKVVNLSEYSVEELMEILRRATTSADIRFNENTLFSFAEANRGTARDIIKMTDVMREHLNIKGSNQLSKADVKAILTRMDILPRGVTRTELKTLLLLESEGEMQLQRLAARNGCNDSKEQRANEQYLFKLGLLEIDGKRRLLPAGREYLGELRSDNLIPKAPKVLPTAPVTSAS